MFGEGGSRARLPAVAGVWMPWSSWSECSAPCDAGVQTRSRACTPPAFGGAECEGPLLQTRDCNPQPCGGACTAGCGAVAPGGGADTKPCCPLSPQRSAPAPCGTTRPRSAGAGGGPAHGCAGTWSPAWCVPRAASPAATAPPGSCCRTGAACHPNAAPATTAATSTSPVTPPPSTPATTGGGHTRDGVWEGSWGAQRCFPPPPLCSHPLSCSTCMAGEMVCGTEPCPGTNPEGATVGEGGPRCLLVLGAEGGGVQRVPKTPPVPCSWSSWTAWSSCSRSCDVGTRRRYRVPGVPPPAEGGPPCQGPSMEVEFCSLQPCRGEQPPAPRTLGWGVPRGVPWGGGPLWGVPFGVSPGGCPWEGCHGVGVHRGCPWMGILGGLFPGWVSPSGCPWGGCPRDVCPPPGGCFGVGVPCVGGFGVDVPGVSLGWVPPEGSPQGWCSRVGVPWGWVSLGWLLWGG